jgi:hypothetical protein
MIQNYQFVVALSYFIFIFVYVNDTLAGDIFKPKVELLKTSHFDSPLFLRAF